MAMRDTFYFLPEKASATLTFSYTGPGIDQCVGVQGSRLKLSLDAKVTHHHFGEHQDPTQEERKQLRTRMDSIWHVELLDSDTYNEYSAERGSIGFLRPHGQRVSACLTGGNFSKLLSMLKHG